MFSSSISPSLLRPLISTANENVYVYTPIKVALKDGITTLRRLVHSEICTRDISGHDAERERDRCRQSPGLLSGPRALEMLFLPDFAHFLHDLPWPEPH